MSDRQSPIFLYRWVATSIGVLLLAEFMPGVFVFPWWKALVAAFVLSILNYFVRPLIQLIALPITFFTLGIFYFVVNAAMVMWAASWVEGFEVDGWGTAIFFSLLISLINTVLLKRERST